MCRESVRNYCRWLVVSTWHAVRLCYAWSGWVCVCVCVDVDTLHLCHAVRAAPTKITYTQLSTKIYRWKSINYKYTLDAANEDGSEEPSLPQSGMCAKILDIAALLLLLLRITVAHSTCTPLLRIDTHSHDHCLIEAAENRREIIGREGGMRNHYMIHRLSPFRTSPTQNTDSSIGFAYRHKCAIKSIAWENIFFVNMFVGWTCIGRWMNPLTASVY